jgi:hypothetical protein
VCARERDRERERVCVCVCGEEVSFVMDVLEAGHGGREERRSLLEEEASRHASRLEKWRNRIRPSAVLEWDEVQKKVVARRMQVGLSVSHLSPSARDSACYNKRTSLVDTFVVPDELAQLKDLKSILSLEVVLLVCRCALVSFHSVRSRIGNHFFSLWLHEAFH